MKATKVVNATKTATKDPVCGMMVDPDSAIHAERDGQTAYFCSETCRKQWLATPANAGTKVKPRGRAL